MKVVQENKRQFLQKVRSLCRKQIFVYIDEEFAIKRTSDSVVFNLQNLTACGLDNA